GDLFLGVRVPVIRQQVKKFKKLKLKQSLELLTNDYHEVRLFAVLKLVDLFEKGTEEEKKEVYTQYLKNTRWVNNWDLVDSSAHKIVGAYLYDKPRDILYRLSDSKLLWDKRIAMISCYYFIKRDDFNDTLKLSEIYLTESHDLMHKAAGWMLREMGKRNFELEDQFLAKHYKKMPRTMLRYALEKFPKERKQAYMKGLV
ncbi:MAG: DNA alkylation repair protein, partial [Kangiellaceae bacterium]